MPTVNSPSQVFNLATLRTARFTRRDFRPFLLFFRAAFNYLTFCLLWLLPRFQRVGCSTFDPPHPPPSCPVDGLLTRDLLPFLLSILRSPRFSRRSSIVAAGLKGRGEPNPRLLGCNPRQRDHASAPRARQYTDEVSAPCIPGTGTRHEAPIVLWSDREGEGGNMLEYGLITFDPPPLRPPTLLCAYIVPARMRCAGTLDSGTEERGGWCVRPVRLCEDRDAKFARGQGRFLTFTCDERQAHNANQCTVDVLYTVSDCASSRPRVQQVVTHRRRHEHLSVRQLSSTRLSRTRRSSRGSRLNVKSSINACYMLRTLSDRCE